jgi:hypothetical protein
MRATPELDIAGHTPSEARECATASGALLLGLPQPVMADAVLRSGHVTSTDLVLSGALPLGTGTGRRLGIGNALGQAAVSVSDKADRVITNL